MSRTLADLFPAAGERAELRLWLKSYAYTRRLLVGAAADPWESASKFLAYFSQAQGLLKPDVAVVEVGELFDSWLQRNPAVRAELAGKRKLSFPLRKWLEQAEPRALLAEVIDAVLANLRGQVPLVLAMPSPRYWLALANRAAGREDVELDNDCIEDAAMYVADLVRSVSQAAVGGLLLEDVHPGLKKAEIPGHAEYLPTVDLTQADACGQGHGKSIHGQGQGDEQDGGKFHENRLHRMGLWGNGSGRVGN